MLRDKEIALPREEDSNWLFDKKMLSHEISQTNNFLNLSVLYREIHIY